MRFRRPDWRRRRETDLRGSFYRWLFFAAGPLEAASVNKALGVDVPSERKRMVGYGSLEDVIDVLDAQLSRVEYLAGTNFTAADLYVGAQLGWLMQFGVVEKRPAFVRYTSALSSRPAAIRAREIDDALLPPKG